MNARTKDGMSILEEDESNIRGSALLQIPRAHTSHVYEVLEVIGSGTGLELAVNTSLTLETHVTTFEGILRYTYIS
jgi:hypothetical protein